MGSKPTHAFVPCEVPDYFDGLVWDAYGKRTCGLPRSAHPAAEPAPESEEPQVTEMRVCEIAELILHPGQLYRFTADPGCWKCASYGAEPARPDPASEPQCACLDFWTTHHPECPRVRAGLEKAGVAAPEPEPCQFASTPHVCHDTLPPHPEPVDVAKTIVEWLDQNVSKCQHGYITVSCGECMGRYLK